METNPCNENLRPPKKALGTTEILEEILLQLDMRSLLTSAQLVNRSWRQLIQKSPEIQRALFFKPQKDQRGDSEPILNPLLVKSFPSVFPKDGSTSSIFSFKSLDMVKSPEKLAAYTRKEASWRSMLVQQPPVSDFAILDLAHGRGGDSLRRYRFKVSVARSISRLMNI